MHIQWTLPNFFFYGLLHILLFCTPSCGLTLSGIIFLLLSGLVPLAGRILGGLEKTTS